MSHADYDNFAHFYDLEYGHKDNDLDFYLDMAEKYGTPVLEIGVGTGRVAIELAHAGYEVLGIDNSANMLAIAAENVKDLPPEVQARLAFHQADMRDFDLGRKFSLCIIPFRAFLHNLTQEEQIATLKNVQKHLSPGGLLALDLFVPLYGLMAQQEWFDKIEPDELAEDDSGITVDIHVRHQPEAQLLNIKNTYHNERDQTTEAAEMSYRYIFRFEMEALLRCAGFKMVHVYGGFEEQVYDFHSGIMVFVAQAE